MLANNKTSEQITEELVDLIGDNYGSFELTSLPTSRMHPELTSRSPSLSDDQSTRAVLHDVAVCSCVRRGTKGGEAGACR